MAQGRLTTEGVPVIAIEVGGQTLDAVIDTGSERGLQLPSTMFPDPAPKPCEEITLILGAGQAAKAYSYHVPVTLDGVTLVAETIFADADDILLGLNVLRHFRLLIDFPAGTVSLTR